MRLLRGNRITLAASWLLEHLSKSYCFRSRQNINGEIEDLGYRVSPIKISSLKSKYNHDILGEASKLLKQNNHIDYQSKDLRNIENSVIYLTDDGRIAADNGFYKKVFIKKWLKRSAWIVATAIAFFGLKSQIIKMLSKEQPHTETTTAKDSIR